MRLVVSASDAGKRADKLLSAAIEGVGRTRIKRLFAEGRVRVVAEDGRARRVQKGDVVQEGQIVEVEVDAADYDAVPDADAPLTIVLETDRVVVADKPSGMPTAPLAPAEKGTLANALLARYPEMKAVGFSSREPGICHRLDTDTSGLVLSARDVAAFEVLTRALREGRLEKKYLLVCQAEGLAESGVIDIPIAPHPKDRRRVLACVHPRDVARNAPRPASTSYVVKSTHGPYALVEASAPKALRHQIRAHFAAIEHPLAGDVLYGGPSAPGLGRQALHAHRIVWRGDDVVPAFDVTSPLPEDIARLVP